MSDNTRIENTGNGREDSADPDLDLIRQVQEGESKAYEELVRRHQRRIFNVACRILGDYDEALDIAQDALIQAYRALAGFRGESRFSHWLMTITVNLCRNRIKYWKRRARNRTYSIDAPINCEDSEVQPDLPDPSPSALEKASARQTEGIVLEEMKALDEEFRTVLVLREIQGMSYEEIGTVLDLAAGTVKSRLHRGRSELRDRLRKRLEPPSVTGGSTAQGTLRSRR